MGERVLRPIINQQVGNVPVSPEAEVQSYATTRAGIRPHRHDDPDGEGKPEPNRLADSVVGPKTN